MGSPEKTDIDWDSLLRKLTAVAINLFRKERLFAGDDSVMKGIGKSPSDYVHEAIMEFYANREKYSVKAEGELFAVIVTILQHDFADDYRRHAYRKSKDVPEEMMKDRELMPAMNDGFSSVDAQILAEHFYRYADGDQELRDVIDAAAILAVEQDGALKRDDIATLLGVSPQEITKRNNRLKYKFHAADGRLPASSAR